MLLKEKVYHVPGEKNLTSAVYLKTLLMDKQRDLIDSLTCFGTNIGGGIVSL